MPYMEETYGIKAQPVIRGQKIDLYGESAPYNEAVQNISSLIQASRHAPFKQPTRKYLGSAGAIRELVGRMYGYNPYGRIGGLDPEAARRKEEELGITETPAFHPLARLEEELIDAYKDYPVGDQSEVEQQRLVNQIFEQRNQALRRMLAAQGAAMGTPGLYQGALSANDAARDTMVSQALAAYKPIQYQMQQQFADANEQLMSTITQLQSAREQNIRGMGRGASFG